MRIISMDTVAGRISPRMQIMNAEVRAGRNGTTVEEELASKGLGLDGKKLKKGSVVPPKKRVAKEPRKRAVITKKKSISKPIADSPKTARQIKIELNKLIKEASTVYSKLKGWNTVRDNGKGGVNLHKQVNGSAAMLDYGDAYGLQVSVVLDEKTLDFKIDFSPTRYSRYSFKEQSFIISDVKKLGKRLSSIKTEFTKSVSAERKGSKEHFWSVHRDD